MPPSKHVSVLGSYGFTLWNWPGTGEEAAEMFGMSHAVVKPANAATIYVAGQVGLREDGTISKVIEEEVMEAFEHSEKALKAAGLGENAFEYVYKINVYFAGLQENPELGPSLGKAMATYCKSTKPILCAFGVQSLFEPNMHIELEVQAFLPSSKAQI